MNRYTYCKRQITCTCTCTCTCHVLTCRSRIGSRAGSNPSPTFSSRQGLPNLTAFSKLLKKSLLVSLRTSRLLFFSVSG